VSHNFKIGRENRDDPVDGDEVPPLMSPAGAALRTSGAGSGAAEPPDARRPPALVTGGVVGLMELRGGGALALGSTRLKNEVPPELRASAPATPRRRDWPKFKRVGKGPTRVCPDAIQPRSRWHSAAAARPDEKMAEIEGGAPDDRAARARPAADSSRAEASARRWLFYF
jgi:hypothetical protein